VFSFTKLNDPMEGAYKANWSGSYLELASMDMLFDRKVLWDMLFSETNNNTIMWAHYADQFCGICIEYDLKAEKMLTKSHVLSAFVR